MTKKVLDQGSVQVDHEADPRMTPPMVMADPVPVPVTLCLKKMFRKDRHCVLGEREFSR